MEALDDILGIAALRPPVPVGAASSSPSTQAAQRFDRQVPELPTSEVASFRRGMGEQAAVAAPEPMADMTESAVSVAAALERDEQITAKELLNLGAVDGEFYCRHWFPRAFRQPSAEFHHRAWEALESGWRHVSIEMFRGAAKTTMLRAFTSKRIAYAESRTIMYVGENQDAAKRSVRWLRRQIMFNTRWSNFFQLRIGTKKTDEWLEIIHGIDEVPITVVAVGITGQIRGVNLDDWRPDLIVVDDPCDEENTNTPEARKKIHKLFFGALEKSLAPPVDNENALMCLLQTPLNEEDLISACRRDPQWHSLTFGCFTDGEQSRWPQRYPTEQLRRDKAAHIARNDLPLWLREMECKIVSEATSSFRQSWLKPYPEGMTAKDIMAEGGQAFLWIDPVPPPSPVQIKQGLKGKDYEAFACVIKYKGEIYLAETQKNRGHEPDWTVMTFWYFVNTYKVFQFGVEMVNYQRTLKWILEQSMKAMGRYVTCYQADKMDKRKKSYRIIDALKPTCSQGRFHVQFAEHTDFIEQYTPYPSVNEDDVIEAVAEATRMAQESVTYEGVYDELDDAKQEATLGSAP